MQNRRKFLKGGLLGLGSLATLPTLARGWRLNAAGSGKKPLVISTWNHGMMANAKAWQILSDGGKAIDAVEAGVMEVENDPQSHSVGLGGRPDREGKVTLDACIMDHEGHCGSVAFLQDIKNPVAVARKVMDNSPHVMLVGKGARDFAVEQGFKTENLLTRDSEEAYKKWLEESKYQPVINSENHDTIGMLALDEDGNLSGSCTTSGAAYKMHGRVGDSPIIGAGLFVDNEIGAACATGLGELVIQIAGSHLIVELMRQGYNPTAACKIAVERITKRNKNIENTQVAFLALNKKGEHGSYSIRSGFNYALTDKETNRMQSATYEREWNK